jgi:hypothetical protein
MKLTFYSVSGQSVELLLPYEPGTRPNPALKSFRDNFIGVRQLPAKKLGS